MIPRIIIAEDGKDVEQGEFKFDTKKRHLPIDLEALPRHYDIAEMAGGTAITISAGDSSVHQETLLTVPHKLGYTPFVFMYVYVISYNGNSVSSPAGDYIPDAYYYSGASGTIQDILTFKVDASNFKIIHYATVFSFFGGAHTSDANLYQLRIKYYISSIDTGITSYSGDRQSYI